MLSSVGAKTEIFLKAVVLPTEPSSKSFEFFVDAIPSTTIDVAHRNAIHTLRKLYNKAKHKPTHQVQLLEALRAISNAKLGFEQVIARGLGLVNSPRIASAQRVYWISACDHYIGGETEVHIHIPGESSHWLGVPSFDHVNIIGLEWDVVKAELASVGTLRDGRGIIPQSQFDAFVADNDSLSPLVFEGAYKDLRTILASHELRLDVIPGLRREDKPWSMIIAILMATCDVAVGYSDRSRFSAEVQQQAIDGYGVPSNYQHLSSIADGMVELVSRVPHPEWANLRGPIWVREQAFLDQSRTAIATHPNLPILISANHEVIVEWSHP